MKIWWAGGMSRFWCHCCISSQLPLQLDLLCSVSVMHTSGNKICNRSKTTAGCVLWELSLRLCRSWALCSMAWAKPQCKRLNTFPHTSNMYCMQHVLHYTAWKWISLVTCLTSLDGCAAGGDGGLWYICWKLCADIMYLTGRCGVCSCLSASWIHMLCIVCSWILVHVHMSCDYVHMTQYVQCATCGPWVSFDPWDHIYTCQISYWHPNLTCCSPPMICHNFKQCYALTHYPTHHIITLT